jgi:hypothetical protein
MTKKVSKLQNYLLAGILTVVPLWITWLVFSFVITQLSRLGDGGDHHAAGAVHPGLDHLAGDR